MRSKWMAWRQRSPLALALPVVLLLSAVLVAGPFNERQVRPKINVEDRSNDITAPDSKVWVMDFVFKEPRLITVDIPGRGRKLCWYLWYQVINKTKEPQRFVPDFQLVTLDKPGVYHDQVLPAAQEAIKLIEDPIGYLNIKNSVTIAEQPIPVSKPDGAPHPVTGVAIWDDVNPDSNRYSIFVSGLSNGWSVAEIPPDNKQVTRRKTLQLNFKRLGDRFDQHSGEIHWVPPAEWMYRAALVPSAETNGAPKAPERPAKPSDAKAPGR